MGVKIPISGFKVQIAEVTGGQNRVLAEKNFTDGPGSALAPVGELRGHAKHEAKEIADELRASPPFSKCFIGMAGRDGVSLVSLRNLPPPSAPTRPCPSSELLRELDAGKHPPVVLVSDGKLEEVGAALRTIFVLPAGFEEGRSYDVVVAATPDGQRASEFVSSHALDDALCQSSQSPLDTIVAFVDGNVVGDEGELLTDSLVKEHVTDALKRAFTVGVDKVQRAGNRASGFTVSDPEFPDSILEQPANNGTFLWVAFHQKAFGKPGDAALPEELRDVTEKANEDYAASLAQRREAVPELARKVASALATVKEAPEAEAPTEGAAYEGAAHWRADLKKLTPEAERLSKSARELEQEAPRLPLHVAERRASELSKSAEGIVNDAASLAGRIQSWSIGERTRVAVAQSYPRDLAPAVLESLREVERACPEAASALRTLATARPQLLVGADPVTGQNFAEQLEKFATHVLRESERGGFATYLMRMAEHRYDWRRGGYSHTVCAMMNSVFNHPGLILSLIEAARADRPYRVAPQYPGDSATELRPIGDLKAGFGPVESTGGWGDTALPPAQLGYERGLLRAIRDELAPAPSDLPPDRFARNADPVAVGMGKLLKQEVRYGYAYNIHTGADLAAAVESQGREGLAFGDLKVTLREDGESRQVDLHFPVFYDYDPKSRTLAFQEWTRGEHRISVDAIEALDKPSLYFRPTPGMKRFLTPKEKPKEWF